MYLQSLCATMPVDMMPGTNEPTNVALPQQPLHRSLFPLSCPYSTFQSVSNPYAAVVDGVSIVGTSGQNVNDVFKYVDSESRLDVTQTMVEFVCTQIYFYHF